MQVPLSELQPFATNPRRGNVDAIAASLAALGQYRPIVANRGTHTGRAGEVLAGNHTLAAAASLGWEALDVHWVDVDEQMAGRIVAADNRTHDLGSGYDDDALTALLGSLEDLSGTGYSAADLDALLGDTAPDVGPAIDGDPDDAPALREDPISEPGDLWVLGPHRLLVGDARRADDLEVLLFDADGLADCLWTDPPYGVSYVGGTGLTIANDGASGLPDLLREAFTAAAGALRPGAPAYVAHADSGRVVFESAFTAAGFALRQNLIWVKNSLVMGRSDYHYQHEPILFGALPYAEEHEPILYGFTPAPKGSGRLGRGGSHWFGGNGQTTTLFVDRPTRSKEHPTMKPTALIDRCLRNSCPEGGWVLDPFAGSGSTMIAAHLSGRRAAMLELDPRYADVICRRFEQATGVTPLRGGVPVTFLEEAPDGAQGG